MTKTLAALREALTALKSARARYALIGGFAVAVRCEPRFTRDVDFAIAVSGDAEAERLIHRLAARGFEVVSVLEHATQGRLSTVRLTAPGKGKGHVLVDLLFASSGIEAEVVGEATEVSIAPRLKTRVARTGHLIAMKLLSRDDVTRPQDGIDLRALVEVASSEELVRAGKATRLIKERGFARGRDLARSLSAMVRAARTTRRRQTGERPRARRPKLRR